MRRLTGTNASRCRPASRPLGRLKPPGVATRLDFVHKQGYVHRDVKPGNILFDAHGHVFLSDFGVAKALASEAAPKRAQTAMTGAGMVLGTPEYMAPELIMGETFDGRIDQYALAVTVYEMVAGRRPFEASSSTACMVMQTTQEPPPLSQVAPQVPQALSEAVAKGLSKDPARRYATCASFATAVVSVAGVMQGATGASRSPSGRVVRADQARLVCPSCARSLVFPAATLDDPEKVRGKRLSCPTCQARLRFSDDARSLLISDPAGGSTGIVTPPPRQATRQVAAPRGATIPVARPPSSQTIRQTVVTPPQSPIAEAPAEPAPSAVATDTKMVKRGAVAAGILGGVLIAAVVAAILAIQGRSGPETGQVVVDASSVARGGQAYSLDGHAVEVSILARPMAMTAGDHELVVTKEGYVPFSRSFPVAADGNTGFKVLLAKEKPPEPEPKPPETVAEAVNAAEPPPPPASSRTGGQGVHEPARTPEVSRSRPKRASIGVDSLRPIPEGPALEKSRSPTLLEKPESFADRAVEPTGLYAIGRHASRNHDGTVTIPVRRITLHAHPGNLATHQQAEDAAMIVADPVLARHLEALKALRIDPIAGRAVAGEWGDNAAVLTFHVQKRMESAADEWVPTLMKIEFLIRMHFLRIGEGKFNDSFRSLTVTTKDPEVVGLSGRHDWSTRLGVPYTQHLKHIVHNIKDERRVTWPS